MEKNKNFKTTSSKEKISVIIPIYNAESTIVVLCDKVRHVLLENFLSEIILINDCSTDSSAEVCKQLSLQNLNIKFISLRKNVGEHSAVMCGLNYCTGDYSVIIDDDLQNPPSEIIKLVQEAQKGYDVVYSKYKKKKHSFFRNTISKINGAVATYLLKKPKNLYLSSFKCIQKDVVKEIIKYTGPFPYIDGLLLRTTSNISSVFVKHQERKKGKSGYTLKKLLHLYFNMFFNFSVLPLRMFTIIGFFIFLVGSILSLAFIIEKIYFPETPIGWTSLAVIILTLSGFQVMFLGLIGEYLGKLYLDQNKTPQWSIKETYNISS